MLGPQSPASIPADGHGHRLTCIQLVAVFARARFTRRRNISCLYTQPPLVLTSIIQLRAACSNLCSLLLKNGLSWGSFKYMFTIVRMTASILMIVDSFDDQLNIHTHMCWKSTSNRHLVSVLSLMMGDSSAIECKQKVSS